MDALTSCRRVRNCPLGPVTLAIALLLQGCGLFPAPAAPPLPTAEATPTTSPALLSVGTPASTVTSLRLWLPVDFHPDGTSPAGSILQAHLRAFEDAHPGLRLEVRLRAAAGPGGLRDMLALAASAAPNSLPDVIALDQPNLHAAALKGLVLPLQEGSQLTPPSDWFPFAQSLAEVDQTAYGVPFAADCMLLVQRSPAPASPPSWTACCPGRTNCTSRWLTQAPSS